MHDQWQEYICTKTTRVCWSVEYLASSTPCTVSRLSGFLAGLADSFGLLPGPFISPVTFFCMVCETLNCTIDTQASMPTRTRTMAAAMKKCLVLLCFLIVYISLNLFYSSIVSKNPHTLPCHLTILSNNIHALNHHSHISFL